MTLVICMACKESSVSKCFQRDRKLTHFFPHPHPYNTRSILPQPPPPPLTSIIISTLRQINVKWVVEDGMDETKKLGHTYYFYYVTR